MHLARVQAPARRIRRGPALVLAGGTLLLLAAMAAGLLLGPAAVSPAALPAVLADALGLAPLPEAFRRDAAILGVIRAPRVLLAALVGAGLGAAGAAMQGLFRNPLADPGLIGVSAGAALAAVAAIVFGAGLFGLAAGALGLWLLPAAAFLGGLGATLLMARLGTIGGVTGVATLLLAGVAVNALAGALTGLLVFTADDRQVRDITFWTLGSLAGARWAQVPVAAALIGLPVLGLVALARPLDALLLGEAEAFHLGQRVEVVKRVAVSLAAIAVAAGVAFTGLIGFVGLVVPHLLRLGFGASHRLVLPGSALLGAALLVLADLAARSLAAPAELPVGVVTALIGAPFFLWLLRRRAGLA
ncbi:FecCD family ABC transporter permease [Falsiroseomonas selenitidurans]|uniref:Iron ABC transporter permease n=1 Tax=Falsiroseomonas selenitidurans TaxID=2716335 RepID=A0ABX1DYT9_9PROT|nr:iron chelate uptake ABC transporter family permease subunit [Falsiroseomonas selenitidurans]NKC29986.1 iron ABC transporter permease [Falsiroseomonas selenitidurans]